MPIQNSIRAVALTTEKLNLPITAGINQNGYWYYYIPTNPGNTALAAAIKPYLWGTALPLAGGASTMTIEGTFPLITETWDGTNVTYHGGCNEWIGAGINDINNVVEDDAFFFAHLGTLSTAPDDDAFYWDRAYDPNAGSDWYFYQYHRHSPTFYATYENGRQVIGANGFIDPADKAFGYMISTQVKVGGITYSSVLARVHTPSIGGAHNSHNDVTLPTTSNKNYMPGGILRGVGERFHCFYIAANGANWDIFSRTYTDAAGSFSAQTLIGTFDLADPVFNPGANQQSQYPVRASAGISFGARIYFPVILNNSVSGFDLEIWSFNSLDTIAGGSLLRQVIATGLASRPDCFCAVLGTQKLYVLYSDITAGGCRLYSFDGTTWTNEGQFLTNNAADPVRVHGFRFNSTDFKWYALLSGTASGGGSTYLGPGLYSFELGEAFLGYDHLDYDGANNAFVKRGPLETGYLRFDQDVASFSRINAIEPQSIAAGTQILDYTSPGNQFYNRKQIGFGGKDYYFHAITLQDGRRVAVGQIRDNEENQGPPESGDFIISLYSADLNQEVHLAAGGFPGIDGDDYLTGIWESQTQRKLWLTGFTKSQVVPKGEIWIHGWCRNLSDGGSSIEWKDMAVDTSGNVYLVGAHADGWLVVAKYSKDYDILWQKRLGDNNSLSDVGLSITVDGTSSVYVSGNTQEGVGGVDALLVKINPSTGNPVWGKIYGTAGMSSESATSVAVISKSGIKYLVMSIVSGTSTTFLATDTDGVIVEQNTVSNLVVNRIRYNQTSTNTGRFLFAGNDGGVTSVGKFGMCELLSPTRFVQWVCTVDATDEVDLNDIGNIASGEYAVCGAIHHDGILIKTTAVENSPGSWTITKDWTKTLELNPGAVDPCSCSFTSLCSTPYTEPDVYIYVCGSAMGPVIPAMGMDEAIITRWTTSGTLDWQNVFGHDMDEQFVSISNDTTGHNIIVAGWSESHSDSRDAIFFRAPTNGFATGIYNLTVTGTAPYYYNASTYNIIANADTFAQISAPTNSAGSLSASSYLPDSETSDYSARDFDGAFGPNGNFSMIIAYLDLDLLQGYLNSSEYKEAFAQGKSPIYISDPNLIGKFYQLATVGDASADDGNIFGYDIIEHSNGSIYAIGQTSGNVTKTNTGASGVYDYILVELDPATGELEGYQNGTEFDEETYALTELSDGRVAYVGRTAGNLGGVNEGGYDIFLGIFDTITEVSDYYSTGSGLDDTAVNVHDLGNNELAIVYFSYGALPGTTNAGSQDIGVIKFNYSTDIWGTAYQTGSNTSELFDQRGKHSALISVDQIAVTASTQGVFADDAITYGYLDMVVAILRLSTGQWSRYQIGTTANEINSSCSRFGNVLLIAGYQGGSFTDDINAVFVEFDASDSIVGRASSVD